MNVFTNETGVLAAIFMSTDFKTNVNPLYMWGKNNSSVFVVKERIHRAPTLLLYTGDGERGIDFPSKSKILLDTRCTQYTHHPTTSSSSPPASLSSRGSSDHAPRLVRAQHDIAMRLGR